VAHTYNPSDSVDRDQKDSSLKPPQANTHHKKRAGGVAQVVGLEFKLQYCKKKKK
jgi:hypothetical protein